MSDTLLVEPQTDYGTLKNYVGGEWMTPASGREPTAAARRFRTRIGQIGASTETCDSPACHAGRKAPIRNALGSLQNPAAVSAAVAANTVSGGRSAVSQMTLASATTIPDTCLTPNASILIG